jgi:Ca2+-binding EF-hand superfamily protein
VDRIHASFSMLDLDATGTIDRSEMIEGLGADKTLFAYEAFNVFDKNHDGGLDFIEFLVAVTKVLGPSICVL